MRSKFSRNSLFFLGPVACAVLALSVPANATRPLMRPAPALRAVNLSIPFRLDSILTGESLGLDQEDAGARKLLLKQANDYVEFRRGRSAKWLETCDAKTNDDPFCRYERERHPRTDIVKVLSGKHREVRRTVAHDLQEGRFAKISGRTFQEVISGVSLVESSGHLDDVVKKLFSHEACLAPEITTALAYKLEERFPEEMSVELASRLYRRSVDCGGKDIPTAQASFRLGLIQVWQHKCEEIPSLMMKVETTPEASQYHARAKYWRYYCANESKNESARLVARETLIHDHPMSFQTLAVSGDDGVAMAQILQQPAPRAAWRSLVRPELNGIIRAAEALVRIDAPALAAEVIDRHVRDLGGVETEVRLYVAVVLNRIGYALPKFKLLSELFQDDPRAVSLATLKLYFPLWYFDEVQSRNDKVDPLLILSLIRQESAFNKVARSRVGARGLMQVMPGTARMVASVQTAKLFDPAINIGVGTKYFLKRLQQYGGDVELTLAAYNAGFGRVDSWKRRYPTDNKMLFLDFIPFRETRDYVSSILRNYYWYTKLYADTEQVTARKPGVVEGRKISTDNKVLAIMSANAGHAAASELFALPPEVNKPPN